MKQSPSYDLMMAESSESYFNTFSEKMFQYACRKLSEVEQKRLKWAIYIFMIEWQPLTATPSILIQTLIGQSKF